MPNRTGSFRQAGHFEVSAPEGGAMPSIKKLVLQSSLLYGIPIEEVPDWLADQAEIAVDEIMRTTGIADEIDTTETYVTPQHIVRDRGLNGVTQVQRQIEETDEADEGEEVSKRSLGARQSWETRRMVNKYMADNPGVSREDALNAILARAGRLRIVDPNAPPSRGQKSFNTRVERAMQEAEKRGEPISREEARKMVSRSMRDGHRTQQDAA